MYKIEFLPIAKEDIDNIISSISHNLKKLLNDKYNIMDLRTIYICFDVKNLKSLLDKFKEVIIISKENVC